MSPLAHFELTEAEVTTLSVVADRLELASREIARFGRTGGVTPQTLLWHRDSLLALLDVAAPVRAPRRERNGL